METNFIPGLELCKQYYWEVVRPILDAHYPETQHSAALLGTGSEILGFDTAMSADHDWSPRAMLFLNEEDHQRVYEEMNSVISQNLPDSFRGYPIQPRHSYWNKQSVQILTARKFILDYLGFDIHSDLEPADWLTFPEQELNGITKGAVYWDGVNLEALRQRFAYYPHDVWLYLLAAGWARIGQEEHLMGRAGIVGDEIGSALIAARLVRDVMRLCFLMEKRYAPYAKWFGSAFAQLEIAGDLTPILQKALAATKWEERQEYLAMAYERTAAQHNELGITKPLDAKSSYFFDRPFRVIYGDRIAQALVEQVTDPAVKQIAASRLIGSMDQFSDSTDLLCDMRRRQVAKRFYE